MHFCVNFRFVIILSRVRKLVALLLLSYRCIVTINVLRLFLTVPWVGLQCLIVVCPLHTHLLFNNKQNGLNNNKGADETARGYSGCRTELASDK